MEKTLVDRLKPGNSASTNGIGTVSTRFLETIMIALISCKAAEDVMSECFEQLSKSDKLMYAIVKRIVFNPCFMQPVAGFIKENVYSTIDE